MADSPEVQVVKLQLALTQASMQILELRGQLAKYQHREAMQTMGQLQEQLRALENPPEAVLSTAEQEMIAKIKAMTAAELPSIVTSQAPDGSLQIIDGATHQPRPLTPVERATLDRIEELRKEAQNAG